MSIRSALGTGTTVELWLPRAVSPSAAAGPSADERKPPRPILAEPLKGEAILIGDDDADVRVFIAGFLRDLGYGVLEADGPLEALRILAGGAAIDLFIVDYAMPEMNGLEVLREARRLRPGLVGLVVSGHAGAAQGAATEGAPLLQKPFKLADLMRVVADLLAKNAA
jgi:CheY-like chemotaxis protein